MATPLPPVRRVTTGFDATGRSIIEDDAPARMVKTVPERPGYRVSNLWATHGSPAPFAEPDRIAETTGVLPPPKGTVIRVIDFPPEAKDPAERDRLLRATFAKLYPDADHRPDGGPHPGMHQTNTVDYAIVIQGEIVAVMDQGETLLKAGDVLVQRGTNHAWSNRSDNYCRIAFVLIDGEA
ncbi:MAG: cupin domain-containing protein [Betaproteobacteria bacterium]|nr:cupin domain-containing protein [Betaproteobacteria bacterium]